MPLVPATAASVGWALALLGAVLVLVLAAVARRWLKTRRQPAHRDAATPGVPAPARAASAMSGRAEAPLARTLLGRYRIDRPLGRGAMGSVYLAHDTVAGRAVAIKTLALASEFEGSELAQARERFFREADMAGRLQHPDIVATYDTGEEQGQALIAMEYVNGHDLFRYTQPARLLPVPTVLYVMARVARALAHAHRHGVVHRDVKPANVMIDGATAGGTASGAVKVTDFGIARITDGHRTRTGLVLGTPSFMAPEQLAGGVIDGRTDLYALGVMLFQLLTGTLPHTAEAMGRLMHQIANDVAPDVRSLRPELPEALAAVVARALEKRPEARYQDGDRFAADLLVLAPHAATFELPGGDSHTDPRHNRPD